MCEMKMQTEAGVITGIGTKHLTGMVQHITQMATEMMKVVLIMTYTITSV